MNNGFAIKNKAVGIFCLLLCAVTNKSLAMDHDRFKESSIEFCSGEANSNLKVSCLLDSMKRVELVKSASESKGGKALISLCANSVDIGAKRGLFDLALCVEKQLSLINNHPNPLWVGLDLNVKKLRTYWVSNCFSKVGPDVNNCVEKQYLGFNEFWNSYLTVPNKKEFKKIYDCVENNIFETDFSRFKLCVELKSSKYTVTK